VFSRARSDNAVSYLSQEDLFLNLMLNMRRDLRELTVRYIYDLYMIVADSKYFDWRYIRELCERNRLMKLFYFSLNALWVLFGYKPPEKISGLVYRGFNRYHFFYWRKRYGYFMRLKVMDSFGEFAMYGREKIKSRIRKRKLNKRAYESMLHCIK